MVGKTTLQSNRYWNDDIEVEETTKTQHLSLRDWWMGTRLEKITPGRRRKRI